MAFRENDEYESENSINRENYVELICDFAKNDGRLAHYLETFTVFSVLCNRIQNDLIEAVTEVIFTDIINNFQEASFIAHEVNETTDF